MAIKLPPVRAGRPAPPDLIERRAASDRLGDMPRAAGAESTNITLAGVPAAVCAPAAPHATLVHFHGGGYRLGSANAWIPFGTRLATAANLRVVFPDYRLAPEFPFPAALHDAMAVVETLATQTQGQPLFLSGDSAGGGLALASAHLAAAAGIAVAGVIMISPWLDLTATAKTFDTCAPTDPLFSRAAAHEASEGYLQGHPADDPLASPLFGRFDSAQKLLALVSGAEVLLEDSLSLAARAAEQGCVVELHIFPGEPHVWPVLRPDTATARRALKIIAAFTAPERDS